jgi:hypothetical protein
MAAPYRGQHDDRKDASAESHFSAMLTAIL